METPSAHFTHSLKSLHLNKQYNQAADVVYVCKSLKMHLIFRLGRGREEEICSMCGVNDAIIVRTHRAHKTITFFSLDYLNIISASCLFIITTSTTTILWPISKMKMLQFSLHDVWW